VLTDDGMVIYGATGYSGQRMARQAQELGLRPLLCGRDARKLETLASTLGLSHRVAALTDPSALDAAFAGASLVLNAAGPFSRTAEPITDACLRAGVHYLDITAEPSAIEVVAQRDAAARACGVMLMPAAGFDVVPTDCLAVHVARRVPNATRIAIAVTNLQFLTRGSARTLLESVDLGAVRRDGALVRVPLGSIERPFDFGSGPRSAMNVALADLVTAYYSTGIPNVETYVEATPLARALLTACRSLGWMLSTAPWQAVLGAWTDLLPETSGAAAGQPMTIVAEAQSDEGRRASTRLQTPEAYEFTAIVAATIARCVLAGDFERGFQTPARVYGPDFVLGFPGVVREDLE
jgi:short subunit dehydrogenase-like uncharacterized protein